MSSSILTNWLENSTGKYFAPKTFDTLVFMQSASQTQGKLVDLPTYFQEAVFNREIKIDLSHNNTCAFGSMEEGSWPGVTGILGTANGGTGRNILTSYALLMGNGTNNVSFINPTLANQFLVSNGTDSAPGYKTLNIESGSDADNVFVGLKLDSSSTYISTYDVPAASNTVAGIVTAIAQTFGGEKTFTDATTFQSDITVSGNIVPETDGYMVGTTNQPWTDVIAWNISADDITSAFGGLRIANGTTQIELVQNDKITLTSSQVDLNCGAITLSNTNYGYELPETGIEGQVFFLLLEE